MTTSDSEITIGQRIDRATIRAKISQRTLAKETGISQPTLSRIVAGERQPKMPEVVAIAHAVGATVAELTGRSTVANRAQGAARATNGAGMAEMRRELVRFLELDAYLDDQAIPAVSA